MMNKKILVVGGAGYIGSHMLLLLKQEGYSAVVLDNLSHGHPESVGNVELIVGDIANTQLLVNIFSSSNFSAVMHFASLIEVAESVIRPDLYY